MATPTPPPRTSEEKPPLSRMQLSHGRGGAGNIGVEDNEYKETEEDLRIPTLSSPIYTTGRGGTGNMALNSDPMVTRAAQDVEVGENGVPRPTSRSEFHGGRGGAGNVVDPVEEARMSREDEEKQRLAVQQHLVNAPAEQPIDHSKIDYRGWADRGKDLLFGKKKKRRT